MYQTTLTEVRFMMSFMVSEAARGVDIAERYPADRVFCDAPLQVQRNLMQVKNIQKFLARGVAIRGHCCIIQLRNVSETHGSHH